MPDLARGHGQRALGGAGGTHDVGVLAAEGAYADLYLSQFA